jgi:hypothetical protein
MISVARCRFASAIGAFAALDLGEVGDDLASGAAHLAGDCLALRVEAQA